MCPTSAEARSAAISALIFSTSSENFDTVEGVSASEDFSSETKSWPGGITEVFGPDPEDFELLESSGNCAKLGGLEDGLRIGIRVCGDGGTRTSAIDHVLAMSLSPNGHIAATSHFSSTFPA